MKKMLIAAALLLPNVTAAQDLSSRQLNCLARAVYFEARGQSIEGQMAVADVVLNRTRHPDFPFTICDVVHQRRGRVCQFSWVCTPLRNAQPRDAGAWRRAQTVARVAARHNFDKPVGMLYFHGRHMRTRWRHLVEVAEIDNHVFYGDRR